jgi:hypothetical protein
MLHIIIGIGNSPLDVFFEVEKLMQAELTYLNTVMYAEVKVQHAKEKYKRWLDNQGVLLTNKFSGKKCLKNILLRLISLFFIS